MAASHSPSDTAPHHLLGHLQAGVDQSERCGVRVVQQRRDPPRAGLSAPLRRPGAVARWLGPQPPRQARVESGWPGPQTLVDFRQPGAAEHPRLLRAVDLRLRDAHRRPAGRRLPRRPAAVAAVGRADGRRVERQLGRRPGGRTRTRAAQPDRAAAASRVRGCGEAVLRASGAEFADTELPDFLPAILEFAATVDLACGLAPLQEHRPGLELLRLALLDAATPYAAPVEAVCALLPGPSPADVAAAKALARTGPPREQVGRDLAPFGSAPAGGPR